MTILLERYSSGHDRIVENHRRGDLDIGISADAMVQIIIDADLANVGRNMNALIATPAEITKSPALTDRAQAAVPQPGPSVLTAPQATPKPTPKGKKP